MRPYATETLRELNKHFEVVVFTASHRSYANAVIDYLDPRGELIQHRIFRDNCITTPDGVFVKDLRVINRDMKDMVLVDNASYSYGLQVENGIPILPFYEDKQDEEFRHLLPYLIRLQHYPDVREANKATFKLPFLQKTMSLEEFLRAF